MIRYSPPPYLGILCSLLLLRALLIAALILYGAIGLSPDEAQYWTWSQQLDWGYYSKPPGIAWQIFLGTQLFGNTPFGVRALSLLMGVIVPLLLYLLARKCRLPQKTAFWTALLFALTPLGILSSLLAITDVGMTLFWICSLIVIAEALEENRTPNYYLLALFIAFGALFKWPIYFFWAIILVMMPLFPSLRSRNYVWGVLASLAGLLPSLIWNMQHDWATFRHVNATIQGSGQGGAPVSGNALEFVGAQAALFSPLLFALLFLAVIAIVKQGKEQKSLFFCCCTTLLLLGGGIAFSLFKKVQGNWCDYAYPSAILLVAWYGCRSRKAEKWMIGGAVLSVVLLMVVFSIPSLQSNGWMDRAEIPYKANPFRHTIGWEKLPAALEAAGYRPDEDFLFSSNYQMSSLLSFYSADQHRAYFFNLFGVRNNQFCYWPTMSQEQLGKEGYYVIAENQPHLERHAASVDEYLGKLAPYFESVEFLGSAPLFTSYGREVKAALIFRGRGYNGKEPGQTELY